MTPRASGLCISEASRPRNAKPMIAAQVLLLEPRLTRDIDATIDTEEISSGDNHRIHRVTFAQPQEARYARILLWGTNPHAKEYGNRYTPTEFVLIGKPLHQ